MQSTVRKWITKMYFKPSIHHIMLAFSTAAQAKDWLKVWLGPASQNRFHESMNSPLAAGVHNTKQNYIIALKSGRRLRRICVEILVHSLSADHMTLWTAHYTEHTRRDEVDRPRRIAMKQVTKEGIVGVAALTEEWKEDRHTWRHMTGPLLSKLTKATLVPPLSRLRSWPAHSQNTLGQRSGSRSVQLTKTNRSAHSTEQSVEDTSRVGKGR